MPFQSEKQRRYLWANEPEIAREWTDRYGARGGGIMRVPLWTGGFPDFFQMNPENIAQAKNLSWKDALNLEKDYKYNPKYTGKDKTSWLGHKRQGLKSLAGIFEGGSNVGGATPLTRKLALGAMRGLRAASPIGAAMLGAEGGARLGDWAYKNWEPATKFGDWAGGGIYDAWDAIKNEFSGSAQAATPDDITRSMQTSFSNISPDIIKRMGVDNVKAMIANAKKKETQVPVAQKLANLDKVVQEPRPGFPHDSSVADFGYQIPAHKKGAQPEIKKQMFPSLAGAFARLRSPFNPKSKNYQPGFYTSYKAYQDPQKMGQAFGRNQPLIAPGGKVISGPMQGYNMVSGWGSNNYRNMISKRMQKQGIFGLRGPNNEIRNQQKYNQLKSELQKETQRQRNLPTTGGLHGGMSYNQYADTMVQDRSPGRRNRPGGIGGKELMAQGGLATLWPR